MKKIALLFALVLSSIVSQAAFKTTPELGSSKRLEANKVVAINDSITFYVGRANSAVFPAGSGAVQGITPSLPTGVSLDLTTGALSGTPSTTQGYIEYTITGGTPSPRVFKLRIVDDRAPAFSYATPFSFPEKSAITPILPTISAGTGITFSVSPSLPTGLNLNTSTGAITGTPAAPSSGNYQIIGSNIYGSTPVNISITINAIAPIFSYIPSNLQFRKFENISPRPAPTNTGGTPTSYAIVAGGNLPDGVSLNTSNGEFFGFPFGNTITSNYTVSASNSAGTSTNTVSIAILNEAAPSTPFNYSPPNVSLIQGVDAVIARPTITGSNITYSSSTLPNGLFIISSTGEIRGTPSTVQGFTPVTITASNAGGSISTTISFEVKAPLPTITYAPTTSQSFVINQAINNWIPTITGTPVNVTITPSLPAGLVIGLNSGIITGTPTALAPSATYVVTATNGTGSTSTTITLAVTAVPPTFQYPFGPYTGTENQAITISPTFNPSGTTASAFSSFSVSPNLPLGLSLNTTTGIITGTPTEAPIRTNYIVTGTYSGNQSNTATISLEILPVLPSITYPYTSSAPEVFTIGVNKTIPPTNTGGAVTGSWSISTALPTGLSLNTSTGEIGGTATSISADATYTISTSNRAGSVNTTFRIQVKDKDPNPAYPDAPYIIYQSSTPITPKVPTNTNGGVITSWSIGPSLPSGLQFDTNTGVISGTPSTLSTAQNYIITATNATSQKTVSVNLSVVIPPPTVTCPANKIFTVGSAITPFGFTTTGQIDSYNVTTALPTGLFINNSTGQITGTPSVVGNYPITIRVTNSTGFAECTFNITVNPTLPTITYTPTAKIFSVGQATGNWTPVITGQPITSLSINPALPAGLIFNSTNGTISGTPSAVLSQTSYTITVENAAGSGSTIIQITVGNDCPINFSYPTPNTYTKGTAIPNLIPTVTSGSINAFSISPSLPGGLDINPISGYITGNPTVASPNTSYTITANNSSCSAIANVNILINPNAPVISYTPAANRSFVVNTPISPNWTIVNTGGPIASVSISPSLPSNLTLNTTTGEISGTPTAIQANTNYTVTATNAGGAGTAQISFSVVANPCPITLTYNPSGGVYTQGTAITSLTPTVTGLANTFTISPNLSAGLVFDPATGTVSGTPSAVQSATTYTINATNGTCSATAPINITVNPTPPNISYSPSTRSLVVNTAITPTWSPVNTGGAISTVSITPALPAGLSFNTSNGDITGTPTALQTTTAYTIVASNAGGTFTTTISFSVIANPCPIVFNYSQASQTYTSGSAITALSPTITSGAPNTYAIS
ncbi:MAG: hypothetical protein RLZZ402_688, partial [Bacteroidota bacterium]